MGRSWESPTGNVFASTIVRLGTYDPAPSTLAFVAALAAFDTIEQIAPSVPIQLKWPNDILTMTGEKLCGILLERIDSAIVIGFGINRCWHPHSLDRPVTDLVACGAPRMEAQPVVAILANKLIHWLQRWRDLELRSILRAWDNVAHSHGTALSVKLADGLHFEGEYAGIADDGALQLRLANGFIRAIHAADVFIV
jgi:BirA family biotin operon repressor/biotin-[acetyl-CoA-carboxylase] ligase